MADHKPTPREIEREVEQERAELKGTVEELFNRFTFEDVWTRVGAYMRDNRGDFGHSFGRMVKEKPLAVALTAVGVSWLLFGPSQAVRESEPEHRRSNGRFDMDDHARIRAKLEDADFSDRRATGPSGPGANSDPWEAPLRSPSPVAPQSPRTGSTHPPASPAVGTGLGAGTTGGTGSTVSPASSAASNAMSEETTATPNSSGKDAPQTASSFGSTTGPSSSAPSSTASGTGSSSPGGVTSKGTGEASQATAGSETGGRLPDEADGSKEESAAGLGSASTPKNPSA